MSLTKGPSISFTVTYEQVEQLASQLSEKERLKLTRKLEKDIARLKLLGLMDEMRPTKAVPEKEVLKASKEARKRVATRYRRDAAAGRR
ncbi:MAG: hypothetical protein QM724_08670 [Flavobacteriales bacterium]